MEKGFGVLDMTSAGFWVHLLEEKIALMGCIKKFTNDWPCMKISPRKIESRKEQNNNLRFGPKGHSVFSPFLKRLIAMHSTDSGLWSLSCLLKKKEQVVLEQTVVCTMGSVGGCDMPVWGE